MVRNFFLFILVCVSFSLCACSTKKVRQVQEVSLKELADCVFVLDDSTVASMEYLQYFQRNDSAILAFTNRYDNSVVLYDYKSKKNVGRIHYEKEGGDGIGEVFSFCYVNDDSIYHYHFNLRTLFRTNNEGKVLEKHLINTYSNAFPDSLFIAPVLFSRTNSPLTVVGDKMLMAGFMMGEVEGENDENRPVMVYYDLKTGKLDYSDSYPSVYHKGHWGGGFIYRNPYFTISPQNEIILSFAADSNLRVHSMNEKGFREYYAGVGGDYVITPIEERASSKWINKDECNRHYIDNLSYGPVFYDKYRCVYYRIARLPDPSIDIHKTPIIKPIEIIVLDKSFEVIGKCRLKEDKYWINQCFVGEDGFHIQVESESEDELRFKTFVFAANEK